MHTHGTQERDEETLLGEPMHAMHDYLERTTWHAGQHTRQLLWMMESTIGIIPDRPIGPETLGGLPMPESIWDPT